MGLNMGYAKMHNSAHSLGQTHLPDSFKPIAGR